MAILRATRVTEISARLPEAFRLFKGAPAGTSRRGNFQGGDDYCSPYLRMEPDERFYLVPSTDDRFRTMAEQMQAKWEELIAGGRIAIRFPFATIEENFPWANMVFSSAPGAPKGSGKCVSRCDGITQSRWAEKKPHPSKANVQVTVVREGARPCSADEDGECPLGCKLKATLKFFVPELYQSGIGVFPIGSIIDVTNIMAQLEPYRGRDLRMLPFSLYRKKGMVDRPTGDGTSRQTENWALNLELDPRISQALIRSSDRRFLAELEGDELEAEVVSEVKAIAPAPLPPKFPNFKDTPEGMDFVKFVQGAISAGDGALLIDAVKGAEKVVYEGQYDRVASLGFIQAEEERGHDAIRDRVVPTPPTPHTHPVDTELKTRLSGIRAFTEHGDEQIKTLAKAAGTTAKKAATNLPDFIRMRRSMIIDWTMGNSGELFADLETCSNEFDAWLKDWDGGTGLDGAELDANLIKDWQEVLQDEIARLAAPESDAEITAEVTIDGEAVEEF